MSDSSDASAEQHLLWPETPPPVEPFLKWAGGKRSLLTELLPRFPRSFSRYYEPFVGGGAVLLALAPVRAIASDQNTWLIDTFEAVRDHTDAVVEELVALPNTKEDFLRIRSRDPSDLSLPARAAQFIYLNKTCFRGLFRVNRKGRFNVPYGAYDRRTHDPAHLAGVAHALRGTTFRHADFEEGLRGITRRDFAYLDPPYVKLGGHSDFNRYTDRPFTADDHARLADLCRHLRKRGIPFLVSQSDTEPVRRLFEGFTMTRIDARREINLNASKRSIGELIISGT